jgi:hypothetical protein
MNDHGAMTLEPAARLALGRTLGQEEQVSNLIAFLAAIDPAPLVTAMRWEPAHVTIARESVLPHRRRRADLLVRHPDGHAALIEVKVSADQHRDQFARYDEWAKAQKPIVQCFLLGITRDHDAVPDGWHTDLTLPALLRGWLTSHDPHAAWLACGAAAVFEDWISQLDGTIGQATHLVVADLVVRRLARELRHTAAQQRHNITVQADRTHPGAACLLVWAPFPGQPASRRAWLCIDLRAGQRSTPHTPWLLRLGVEVDPSDSGNPMSVARARVDAHDLAVPLQAAFTGSAVLQSIADAGRTDLSAAIAPRPRTHDGLRASPGQAELDAWRRTAMSGAAPGDHPALFHDWGRRLTGQLSVDVRQLDRCQLLDLVLLSLDHLRRAAG